MAKLKGFEVITLAAITCAMAIAACGSSVHLGGASGGSSLANAELKVSEDDQPKLAGVQAGRDRLRIPLRLGLKPPLPLRGLERATKLLVQAAAARGAEEPAM